MPHLKRKKISHHLRGIEAYIKPPSEQGGSYTVQHDDFSGLPEPVHQLIQDTLQEVYGKKIRNKRVALHKQIEFFLHLIQDALNEAECTDEAVNTEISNTRKRILSTLSGGEFSAENMKWLRGKGCSLLDILNLAIRAELWRVTSVVDPIQGLNTFMNDLRDDMASHPPILANEEYFLSILRMDDGLAKVRKLIGFDINYKKKKRIPLDGAQLQEILSSVEWRDKLEYLIADENADSLVGLKWLGFKGPSLVQILETSNWEERLNYLLKNIEGIKKIISRAKMEPAAIADLFCGDEWRKKLQRLFVQLRIKSPKTP